MTLRMFCKRRNCENWLCAHSWTLKQTFENAQCLRSVFCQNHYFRIAEWDKLLGIGIGQIDKEILIGINVECRSSQCSHKPFYSKSSYPSALTHSLLHRSHLRQLCFQWEEVLSQTDLAGPANVTKAKLIFLSALSPDERSKFFEQSICQNSFEFRQFQSLDHRLPLVEVCGWNLVWLFKCSYDLKTATM